jgi:hypothetical protein
MKPDIDLALKISRMIHNECKAVPHDIGLRIEELIRIHKKMKKEKEFIFPKYSREEEMHLNMQYYYEYCERNGYVTPQEWIEKHKHF